MSPLETLLNNSASHRHIHTIWFYTTPKLDVRNNRKVRLFKTQIVITIREYEGAEERFKMLPGAIEEFETAQHVLLASRICRKIASERDANFIMEGMSEKMLMHRAKIRCEPSELDRILHITGSP